MGQGPRPGPGSGPGSELGPMPRPGLGMGPRGPLRAPGFRPGVPRGENIGGGGGGGQFGRRPPPAMRQPDQEGPPHPEFEFEPLGPPPRVGGGGGGGPTKPPSLLDIPVRPAGPGGGLKRKWEPESGGLHDTFEPRLGGDGPPDGGQFGQMPPEMMNRGPLPPPPQPTPLMDDELMEGPPGGHLGRGGRGFFRGVGGPFHAGGPVRGRGGMRGGLGR